jgi:hypothetical protein
MGRHGLDRSGLVQGQAAGFCECCNEPSGFIKCRKFPDYLRTGWLVKKGSAPCSELAGGYKRFPRNTQPPCSW